MATSFSSRAISSALPDGAQRRSRPEALDERRGGAKVLEYLGCDHGW